jgi:Ca2+:H+ antiporter
MFTLRGALHLLRHVGRMNSVHPKPRGSLTSAMPWWTMVAPVLGGAIWGGSAYGLGGHFVIFIALGLAGNVFAAVHHAEIIARRVGEPYGTLVLALAVTLIEVALIASVMIAGGPGSASLARDTVFAAVMIILNGIIGLSLLVGGLRYREQAFSLEGASAAQLALATIAVMTLVFPNYTVTIPGPFYSPGQLGLVAIVSVAVYGAFIFTQTVAHRPFFLQDEPSTAAAPPGNTLALASAFLLLLCLATVVGLAHNLAPQLEAMVTRLGAPNAVVGVIIAGIVLLPEGLAALSAARHNRLQTSLNLALGSALASIGLTIPAISLLSLAMGSKLVLGIDSESTVLLMLSLFAMTLVLRTGRTIILHGVVLLVIFAIYLFTTVVP